MIHKVDLPRRDLNIDYLKMDDNVFSYTKELAITVAKQVDEAILSELYTLYKGKADALVVIDEKEFEEFIMRYLPIYTREKNDVKNQR